MVRIIRSKEKRGSRYVGYSCWNYVVQDQKKILTVFTYSDTSMAHSASIAKTVPQENKRGAAGSGS